MNPIIKINNAKIPTPSSYKMSIQDVSAPGAGRTLDSKMHKKKIAQKVKIELSWKYVNFSQGTTILNLTGSEYFTVTFIGIKGTTETKEFYRGDVSADFYGEPINGWAPLSFNIIER